MQNQQLRLAQTGEDFKGEVDGRSASVEKIYMLEMEARRKRAEEDRRFAAFLAARPISQLESATRKVVSPQSFSIWPYTTVSRQALEE